MASQQLKLRHRTFIREWRKASNLTLRGVVDRLADRFNFVTTEATLSRVERGAQPYSQPLLEALATVLGTSPGALLLRPPGQMDEIVQMWERLTPEKRKQAAGILKLLVNDSEDAA